MVKLTFRIRELGNHGKVLIRYVRVESFDEILIGWRCLAVEQLDEQGQVVKTVWPEQEGQ